MSGPVPWKPFLRWAPFAVFLLFICGVIVSADRGTLGGTLLWIHQYPFLDKAGHAVLIGTLAFLLNHALAGRKLGPLQLGGVLVAALMTLEECSQAWLPTRQFDLGDLAANYAGVLCAEIAWRVCRGARRTPV